MSDHHYGHGNGNGDAAAPRSSIDADKIFVGGLSWQTTEESLRYHFEQYGPVTSVEVMKDRVTGDPRGFAFVVFASSQTVDLVMESKPHEVNHKIVDVKRAQARGVAPPSIHHNRRQQQQQQMQQQDNDGNSSHKSHHGGNSGLSPEQLQNKVFVGGLPPSVDNAELKAFFEQFAPVTDAIVMMDQVQQRSRGFGFVTFENGSGGAQKAVANQPVTIHGRRAEVKIATPKGEQHGSGGGHTSSRPRPSPHQGLRAGVSSSTGEFAGLAAAYGRSGWKAGYGSLAFGAGGWKVKGWETFLKPAEQSGFSFDMLRQAPGGSKDGDNGEPQRKRARH